MKCWECGKEATRTRVIRNRHHCFYEEPVSTYVRCYCEECKNKLDKKEKQDMELYIKLKKREMFLRACKTLENQNTNMYDFKDAIDVVEDYIETNPDKFDSSYEVLAAIILVKNKIYSKMQYKIGRYQVDFLLPEMGVVLEIDGDRHKHRKSYDNKRDEYIIKHLGYGWDIIRIDTELLDENAKQLPRAINKVIEYREEGKVNWRTI